MSLQLVEASAGTGKTHRIAQVWLRLLLDGLPVDAVLVMTFSRAATAELRGRLRAYLLAAVAAFEGAGATDDLTALVAQRAATRAADLTRLREVARRFDEAPLSTLHGFCADTLLRFGLEAGAAPGVELIGDATALIDRLVEDAWVSRVAFAEAPLAGDTTLAGWRALAHAAVALPDAALLPPPERPEAAAAHALTAAVRANLPRALEAGGQRTLDGLVGAVRDALHDVDAGPALRAALRGRYRAVLVDEFQDTDPAQWALLQAAFGDGHPLVLVGDPKQSIYAFRGADLPTYFVARAAATRAKPATRNHRTDAPLVEAVAHLFGRAGLRRPFRDDAIAPPPAEAAHPSRLEPPDATPLRVTFVPREAAGGALRGGRIPRATARVLVPQVVAVEIEQTLAAGLRRHAEGTTVAVTPRDVAVLVRTHAQAAAVQAALRARGVPAVLRTPASVLERPEAADLLRVLHGVLDPSNAGAVRAALATDLLGVDAAGLVALGDDEAAWGRWVERLRAWHDAWMQRGFMAMFRGLLGDADVPARLLARPDGERALTDLLHIGELLHAAERRRHLRPAGLLGWLAAGGPDLAPDARQLRRASDADAVTVTTVHASKGLAWPLVWAPFLWSPSPVGNDSVVRFPDPGHDGRPTLAIGSAMRAARTFAEQAARAEDVRLAYVALTRARHRCHVVWGAFEGAEHSALGWLLHQRVDAPDARVEAETARFLRHADDATLWGELEALGHGVAAVALPPYPGPPTPAADAPAEPLRARTFDRTLDLTWRRVSFSSMTRGAAHVAVVRDHDARPPEDEIVAIDDEAPPPAPPAEADRVPLHAVRGGARFGTCLHRILELHDFTEPDALPALVDAQLIAHGLDAALSETLTAALQAALDTPLTPDGPTLSTVPRSRRLDELDFYLPLRGGFDAPPGAALDRVALAEVFRRHAEPDLAEQILELPFGAARGFLTGSIDLVFALGGRTYVVDYKSNNLGPAVDDYDPAGVAAAMRDHHYRLQGHLYTVALHRYLRWRVPDYAYETHVGGLFYLFLRGMSPAHGSARGVWHHRPTAALIEDLEATLCGAPEGAG
ncbi:MAG: UvrD-helicase domain-containing protein [Myxococcales bacterium]|nr:UvrD-helicase domain-containing protein [Myxococcales bacterium]